MKKAQWRQPNALGLACKLNEINERLNDLLPQIVEAHAKALDAMAQTAVVSEKAKKEGDSHE